MTVKAAAVSCVFFVASVSGAFANPYAQKHQELAQRDTLAAVWTDVAREMDAVLSSEQMDVASTCVMENGYTPKRTTLFIRKSDVADDVQKVLRKTAATDCLRNHDLGFLAMVN